MIVFDIRKQQVRNCHGFMLFQDMTSTLRDVELASDIVNVALPISTAGSNTWSPTKPRRGQFRHLSFACQPIL
ncbi:hypothetical protein PM04_16515 [Thalassobacter sp. 16PALIMAR09]|nr:hypothetical protein PM04_16515 [Thalassobacter sp. 16PALIMAR09]